jgi:glucose 1-dehydrogenase
MASEERPDRSGTNGVPLPRCGIRPLLKGQTVIVTGASSGIGRAIAIGMGRAGANVCVNYLGGEDAARAVADEIRKAGSDAMIARADVSREDQVAGLFAEVCDRWGSLQILVNNAGIQKDASFAEMSLEDWNAVIAVNLTGQFLCAREAVRRFTAQGIDEGVSCAAGKIICIGSVHSTIPWAGHVNYAASKGGVDLLMKSIAQEVAERRIRVNAIAPGAIRTPINEEAWSTEEAYGQLMETIPYDRIGEPEDVGRLAVWLASDEADYIVGQTIFIDGGMTLYPGFADNG